jgi:hypothetical protein
MASVATAEVATARVGVPAARETTPVGAAAAAGMPATSAAAVPEKQVASVATAEVTTARVGVTAARETTASVGAAAAAGMPAPASVPATRERRPGDEGDRERDNERKCLG